MKLKIKDMAKQISERENNPSSSSYERFVGLEHYISGEIEIDNFGSTERLDSAMKVFKSGDVLIARRNVYLRRAGIVWFDGLTSGDSIVLRANNELYQSLLPFILNTDAFWNYADQNSDGTMSKRLSPKILMEYEVELPEIAEQKKLSELLWAIYKAKKQYAKLLTITDELVKAQYIELFGDQDDNPMEWPIRKLSEVASVDGNMTTDYEKYADYPHIGIDSIEKGTGYLSGYRTVKEDNVISGKYVFGPNHILYSKIRPALNKVALPDFEGLCSADCYPILPDETICRKKFLAHVMRSDFFLKYVLALSARSQMPKVNRKQLLGFEFPCPPVEKQDIFVSFIEQSEKSKMELQMAVENTELMIKSLVNKEFV